MFFTMKGSKTDRHWIRTAPEGRVLYSFLTKARRRDCKSLVKMDY